MTFLLLDTEVDLKTSIFFHRRFLANPNLNIKIKQKRGLIQFHVINNSLTQETGKDLKKFKIFENIQQK